jgi:hypothetical protein
MSEKEEYTVENAGFYAGDYYEKGDKLRALPATVKYDLPPHSNNLKPAAKKASPRSTPTKTKKVEKSENSDSEA